MLHGLVGGGVAAGALATEALGRLQNAVATAAATTLGSTVSAGTVVRLVMTGGPSMLRDALNRLSAADVTPSHVALREPTLDDVFLTLTGDRATS